MQVLPRPHLVSIARCYSQAALLTKSKSQPPPQKKQQPCIRQQLRELLRESAQPVAVVTAFMPSLSPDPSSPTQTTAIYHGATLSSFTSIAMDPYPLIAFALRIPSRMALSLNSAAASAAAERRAPESVTAHMVINILASTQAKHALAFSRPDLFPTPFSDPDIRYTLTNDDLPILTGSLGSLSCCLVGPGLPLHDLNFLSGENGLGGGVLQRGETKQPITLEKGMVASEMFIARVTRVDCLGWQPSINDEEGDMVEVGDTAPRILPLLYHRRQFTSCSSSKTID